MSTAGPLLGSDIIREVKRAGIRFVGGISGLE
jgi:hypothetical protein